MRYAVVIEKAQGNYSAYVPDLPGCVSTGATIEEVEQMIREAIEFHLEGLRAEGLPIPEPTTITQAIEV
jgi:predicted RNase H-like HicB family nuclease